MMLALAGLLLVPPAAAYPTCEVQTGDDTVCVDWTAQQTFLYARHHDGASGTTEACSETFEAVFAQAHRGCASNDNAFTGNASVETCATEIAFLFVWHAACLGAQDGDEKVRLDDDGVVSVGVGEGFVASLDVADPAAGTTHACLSPDLWAGLGVNLRHGACAAHSDATTGDTAVEGWGFDGIPSATTAGDWSASNSATGTGAAASWSLFYFYSPDHARVCHATPLGPGCVDVL